MHTICAISTPAGVGGIAVVRLSGAEARSLASKCLRRPDGSQVQLDDRHATFLHFYSGNMLLDEVVATFFAAPRSYTGEDVVEIACHGSLYVQQQALQTLVDLGARLAEPGEFTLRAFRNGRMDLSQAEAVADLIDSTSAVAHRLAVSQLRGGYAAELETLRQELIDLTALMELELDFSEEDLQFVSRDRMRNSVDTLTAKVKRLVESFHAGNAFKNGIPVAIVGRPNAGKSSLLNALLGDDRAIVSSVPGTTRDTVEDTMAIDGMLFRFIDTAGLRQSDDEVESLGFERTIRSARQARFILYVRDMQEPFNQDAQDDMASLTEQCDIGNKHLFVVHNKCDLPRSSTPVSGFIVSAKQGTGIAELKRSIAEVARGDAQQNEGVLLTNIRHYEALKRLLSALDEVRKGLEVNLTPDLLAIDMRDALYHLGTITGKVTSDEVLSSVFSRFCVGK